MKKLAILLSFFLLFSLVSCASTGEKDVPDGTESQTTTTAGVTTTAAKTTQQTTTQKPETTTKEPENPFAKRLEITYLTRFCDNYEEGRWDELELEEKFNIDLKVWNIDAYSAEQCAMMAAAGDWADTGYINGYDPVRGYNEGLTRNVSLELEQIKIMLPEYYTIL